MAKPRKLDPVMHVKAKDTVGVEILANNVHQKGVYANPLKFPDIPVDAADFKAALLLLINLNAISKKDKTQVVARNAQALVVFEMLEEILLYAKGVCDHDAVMIGLSGFDSNYQPTKVPVPDAPVITKVQKTNEAGVYKVYVKRNNLKVLAGNTPKASLKNVKYMIQRTTTADDPKSWVTIEDSLASTKLFFTDVVQGKRNYIRLIAINNSGKSNPSAPFPFTPEID